MAERKSARIFDKRVKTLLNGQSRVTTPSLVDIKQTVGETRPQTGLHSDVGGLIAELAQPTRYWWWSGPISYKEWRDTYFFLPADLMEFESATSEEWNEPFFCPSPKRTEAEIRELVQKAMPPSPPPVQTSTSLWVVYQSILKNLHTMLEICVAKGWMSTALE